jgi:beta-glucanase (GH16 family)
MMPTRRGVVLALVAVLASCAACSATSALAHAKDTPGTPGTTTGRHSTVGTVNSGAPTVTATGTTRASATTSSAPPTATTVEQKASAPTTPAESPTTTGAPLSSAPPATTSPPATTTTAPDSAGPVGPPGPWRLAFSDDFAGTTLDTDHWSTCYYWNCTNSGNHEEEWYEASQVTVHDGTVSLTAEPTPKGGLSKAHDQPYISGMLSSYGKFSFLYGYAQVVAKLPAGQAMWPAFWTLPEAGGWPPEIDIMENLAQYDRVYIFVHYPPDNQYTANVTLPSCTTEFHTYGVDWEPGSITWYLDGVEEAHFAVSITEPEYLLANLAVADNPGPATGEQFPVSMVIQSIKVWQHP